MMDTYTRVLEIAAETADEAVAETAVTKLITHLKSAGREKLLPSIAAELRKIAARRRALRPVVEVAHADDERAALLEAKEAGIDARHAVVNPSLISGWRGRTGSVLVDRSGKRALIDIYRNVTS
ncbi:MAG TPA: hypothetical protein VEB18_03490 [Candidatus Paceibacterota bacterium]|nr:hypothetical protein [Candidatus Paceibacterota bacterium]